MFRCQHHEGCTARPTHRIRLIAQQSGEVVEMDFCTPHYVEMDEYIQKEVPESRSNVAGTIKVDAAGNQINEGMVQ